MTVRDEPGGHGGGNDVSGEAGDDGGGDDGGLCSR